MKRMSCFAETVSLDASPDRSSSEMSCFFLAAKICLNRKFSSFFQKKVVILNKVCYTKI